MWLKTPFFCISLSLGFRDICFSSSGFALSFVSEISVFVGRCAGVIFYDLSFTLGSLTLETPRVKGLDLQFIGLVRLFGPLCSEAVVVLAVRDCSELFALAGTIYRGAKAKKLLLAVGYILQNTLGCVRLQLSEGSCLLLPKTGSMALFSDFE